MNKNNNKTNKVARTKRRMRKVHEMNIAQKTVFYTIGFVVFTTMTAYDKLKEFFVKGLKLSSILAAIAAIGVISIPVIYLIGYAIYCQNTTFWNAIFDLNGSIISAFSNFFEAIR